MADAPSAQELSEAFSADEQPAVILGDPTRGVVAAVECDDGARIRLLAVDPTARRAGLGDRLLQGAEDWAVGAGHRSLATGADPPYFLWPGVPSCEIPLICLLERRHYSRVDTNFNMDVDLQAIPVDPGGHALAGPGDAAELDEWMTDNWPNWRLEVLRALHKGNLVIAREQGEGRPVVAFCAFEVNRRGLLGPVAVRPDLMGQGRGKGVLLGALHELRRRGAQRVAVVWIGPVAPYAAVGGQVSDVFFVYRKELA
jgi:predicted N-acetyltransferase YhbS